MRILLFSIVDYPNGDASSAHAALVVKGLRANGVDASLVIPHASLLGNDAGNARTRGHEGGVPFLYLSGSTRRRVGAIAATMESLRGMLRGALLVIHRKLRGRLEAVLLGTPDSLEYAPVILACVLFRIPMVVWVVERMTATRDAWTWRQKLRLSGYSFTETILPRFAAGYIVISTALMEYYRGRLSPERLLLSPILVDPSSVSTASVDPSTLPGRTILYSGTFGEKDGVEYLLRAFKILHDRYPDARMILTGKSANENVMRRMTSLAEGLGVADAVDFKGFVSRRELDEYQRRADLLTVCRTNSMFAHNGFPWKLGEYTMLGKPIVATRVGDVEHYFKDGEHLYLADPEDPESIASKLLYVFDHPGEAAIVGQRCRERGAEAFDYVSEGAGISWFVKNLIHFR